MNIFKIALLQIMPEEPNQNSNLAKGLEACRKAKDLGADIALFPELWDKTGNYFREFVKLAKEIKINIAFTYREEYSPKPRNTVSIIDKHGNVVLNYSKVFICNYDNTGCDYNFTPGTNFNVCTLTGDYGDVKLGAMICADREFPEAATQLMLKGAEIIIVPNDCEFDEIRKCQLKARAFENFAGIAMTNYPTPKNNGHSIAFHPAAWNSKGQSQDTLILEAGEEEGIFLAEFDLDQIRNFKKMESWRVDYRKNFNQK